jgi:hypothetical protein
VIDDVDYEGGDILWWNTLGDKDEVVSLLCDDMRVCGLKLDNQEEMGNGGSAGVIAKNSLICSWHFISTIFTLCYFVFKEIIRQICG